MRQWTRASTTPGSRSRTSSASPASAPIARADGTVETFDAPTTIKLRKGDALLEPETDVHQGGNETKKPVVITVAALLAQGAPFATPIEAPGG